MLELKQAIMPLSKRKGDLRPASRLTARERIEIRGMTRDKIGLRFSLSLRERVGVGSGNSNHVPCLTPV